VIDTASGRRVDLLEPSAGDVVVEDVAAALSKIGRFGAQAREFISVAQHALWVHDRVAELQPELALYALHHDSHEAFVCDLPRPLKLLIKEQSPVYEQTSDRLDAAIARALGFEAPERGSPEWELVHGADNRALVAEAKRVLHREGAAMLAAADLTPEEKATPRLDDELLDPGETERRFLDAHRGLSG
jgi:hypothetical protein